MPCSDSMACILFLILVISSPIDLLYLTSDLRSSGSLEGRWTSGNSPSLNSFASLYESSLSFFFEELKISESFMASARCTEKPMSLSKRATYFPDVDISSAISGFNDMYFLLNSSHDSSLFLNSYCSAMLPSSFSCVKKILLLCTSKPIQIPTTSKWPCESFIAGD